MSAASRVALVTGANKGIGFAIARELCRQFSGDVVLTARDEARGRAAVQQLQAEGLSPRFHLLDIDDLQSIRALRDFLRKEYGGLDVLVNNAGIAFKTNDPTPFHIQAEVTMKTNFFGTRDVCTELLPLMKPQGRVVNVSSVVSVRALKSCSPELQQKFRSEAITEEELVGLMNKFVEDTKKGVHRNEGWPDNAYGVTKIGVTVLSRIHARKLSEQRRDDKILLNACCPGWVRTDMAGPRAPKSPEEGAETPVYLALLPSDAEGPHGEFLMEKKVEQWDLCRNFPGDMVLTVRDQTRGRGRAARQHLKAEGLSLHFHLLAIDNLQSIRTLRDFLWEEFGGLDVLVNNAGITFKCKNMGTLRTGDLR
uniref:Carbonyl reductase [NADPH] 1 n=1 Tax=Canis lupus familiaris TaxID=9615 RepID=A0A8C0T807_CANLF